MSGRRPDDPVDPALRRLARAYRSRAGGVGVGVRQWVVDVTPRRGHIKDDLLAGLPGAISSVPDGMAASVLAGVPPTHGLYASFAGPIAGGFTSSTRLMVVTTTSAAALAAGSAIAGVPADQRSDALLWLTLLAGGVMLLAAAVGMSRYVRFVSHSVMLGFLTGVAVNMVLGQLPDLLGAGGASGSVAVAKAYDLLRHPGLVDGRSAAIGVAALALLVLLGRTRLAVVSSLFALAVPTLLVLLLGWGEVARVADGGALPGGLPAPGIPDLAALDLSVVAGAASVAVIILVQGAGVAEAVPNLDGSPPAPVGTSPPRGWPTSPRASSPASRWEDRWGRPPSTSRPVHGPAGRLSGAGCGCWRSSSSSPGSSARSPCRPSRPCWCMRAGAR